MFGLVYLNYWNKALNQSFLKKKVFKDLYDIFIILDYVYTLLDKSSKVWIFEENILYYKMFKKILCGLNLKVLIKQKWNKGILINSYKFFRFKRPKFI